MRLLVAHKILVCAALGLAALMLAWGAVYWRRGEQDAWVVFFLGAFGLGAGSLYARRLWRNPPIK